MALIPPGPSMDYDPLSLDSGLEELVRAMPGRAVHRVLDSILFHLALVELPLAETPDQLREIQAQAVVVRKMKSEIDRMGQV